MGGSPARPPQASWHSPGGQSLDDTAAAAQPPAKLRINPNGRGYGGPGTCAPSRQAAPAPVPKSTLLVHVRAPASRASLRLPPPEPAWLRRVGGPLPGGKLDTGLSFLNPQCSSAKRRVTPGRTGSVSPLRARRARSAGRGAPRHWGHRSGTSPGAQGLGRKQPRKRTIDSTEAKLALWNTHWRRGYEPLRAWRRWPGATAPNSCQSALLQSNLALKPSPLESNLTSSP